MKYIFPIFSLLLFQFELHGQINYGDISFFENTIRQKQDTNKIFYVDSLLTNNRYSEFIGVLKKKRLFKIGWPDKNDSIRLSNQEHIYILNRLKEIKKKTWPDKLFENSEKISSDSIWNTLAKIHNRIWSPNHHNRIWGFAEPIIFREGNYALIYFFNICGGACGDYDLAFYKRENKYWKKWITIAGATF